IGNGTPYLRSYHRIPARKCTTRLDRSLRLPEAGDADKSTVIMHVHSSVGWFKRGNLKAAYVLCFFCGVAVMLGYTTMGGSNSRHHVYELRMYHVNTDKMEALKARFRDPTDAIFKRHE